MLRSLILAALLCRPLHAGSPTASPADAASSDRDEEAAAEAMLTDAIRLLAAGHLEPFMDRHCGDCDTKSSRDRWRRYQLSTATRNAPYCLHGAAPGRVEVVRWQGSLTADGKAKAYLRCGGGQHAEKQESRLPPPITVERRSDGDYWITQLSI